MVHENGDGTVLVANGVRKSFGRKHVLNGVELSLERGTLVGIIGENGSGKSTLLKILAGELQPNDGNVTYAEGFGYCPQTVILNPALSVRQHIEYFQAAYGLDTPAAALDVVGRLGYEKYLDERVANLSGGTQQKLNLTLALMNDPGVLLLDEPYQGFDWETYLRFWELAAELRTRGRAVLVISHLIFDRERFDHVYELEEGRLHDAPPVREDQKVKVGA